MHLLLFFSFYVHLPFHFWHLYLRITSFYILAKWVMSKQYLTQSYFPGYASAQLCHRGICRTWGDNGAGNLPAHTRAYWSFQSGSRVHQCPKYPPTKPRLFESRYSTAVVENPVPTGPAGLSSVGRTQVRTWTVIWCRDPAGVQARQAPRCHLAFAVYTWWGRPFITTRRYSACLCKSAGSDLTGRSAA